MSEYSIGLLRHLASDNCPIVLGKFALGFVFAVIAESHLQVGLISR